ncbi:MAG TPA: GNAT family N-acetyltransferase [Candidatus Lustribacter sp.]|jgi:GNAT superfamily N-acetyltransferase|nr:GNAT family N-acetyltransferase [Candidatus Lustribacter sp.]
MPSQNFPATVLEPGDRERWTELWRGYLTFYETTLPDAIYEATWARIMDPKGAIHALGVRDADGRLVGITHYLFHAHAWATTDACYLQDLFVDAALRGRGYARALIEAVAAVARERNCCRLYWSTQETNATARLLYDRVAKNRGFIRYEYPL